MAEFESGLRKLLHQQQCELQHIISTSQVTGEPFDPIYGSFRVNQRVPDGYIPRLIFYYRLLREDPNLASVNIDSGRVRVRMPHLGINPSADITQIRVIDERFLGEFPVDEIGLVKLTGEDAPIILLHPDYKRIEKVRIIPFDSLVDFINTDLRSVRPPLDALVIGQNNKLISKKVSRRI